MYWLSSNVIAFHKMLPFILTKTFCDLKIIQLHLQVICLKLFLMYYVKVSSEDTTSKVKHVQDVIWV